MAAIIDFFVKKYQSMVDFYAKVSESIIDFLAFHVILDL